MEATHLSDADYNRLRSTDSDFWSEDDLARFLVLDVFVAPKEATWAKDIQKTYVDEQRLKTKKYSTWKLAFDISDKFFLNIYLKSRKHNRKSILFQSSRSYSIMLEAKKHYNVALITEGKKDRLFALRNFLGYMGTNDLDEYISAYLQEMNAKFLYAFLKKVENKLRVLKPDYIVLRDDCFPITRAISLVSKKLGITTIVIQDGVYDSHAPLFSGKAADYIFVWGDYVKDLYVKQNVRKPEEVYVLGYPYFIEKNNIAESKPPVVCYLGQDFERYDKNLLQIKLETIKRLCEVCGQLGLRFLYRPHPSDNRKLLEENLPGIIFSAPKEKLNQTIARADIFISFNSTALIEATIRQKITLQLLNYPIVADNFEELGACSKSFKNIIELEIHLKSMAESQNLNDFKIEFNNYCMETRGNLNQNFLEIIKKIEKNKNINKVILD